MVELLGAKVIEAQAFTRSEDGGEILFGRWPACGGQEGEEEEEEALAQVRASATPAHAGLSPDDGARAGTIHRVEWAVHEARR